MTARLTTTESRIVFWRSLSRDTITLLSISHCPRIVLPALLSNPRARQLKITHTFIRKSSHKKSQPFLPWVVCASRTPLTASCSTLATLIRSLSSGAFVEFRSVSRRTGAVELPGPGIVVRRSIRVAVSVRRPAVVRRVVVTRRVRSVTGWRVARHGATMMEK